MVFEELSNFTRSVNRLITDESYAELQFALAANPELGKVIRGSGGLRKVRWALPGRGKSGGVRVIYYWWVADNLITLAEIYPKNEKEDLTTREIESLRRQIQGL
jgi:mRNA-degrading endonuclease RelE of RelBE toxin-antitoxin system